MNPKIVFFGTPDYSLIVLNRLYESGFPIVGIVTKPPRQIGRKKELVPTPVAVWADMHKISVLTPESDETVYWKYKHEPEVIQKINEWKPDLLVVADYTQKIPQPLIESTRFGGLNVHPSLLPQYRGPAPVPWALLNGETETGVSIVTLAEEFDSGIVIAQQKEPILKTDTTDTLLIRLFQKGAQLLIKTIPEYISNPASYELQATSPTTYYPRLTRDHGFEPWEKIKQAIDDGFEADRIERKFRAFHPWPGLWTKIVVKENEQRLKITAIHISPKLVLDEIQFEGKKSQKVNPRVLALLMKNN